MYQNDFHQFRSCSRLKYALDLCLGNEWSKNYDAPCIGEWIRPTLTSSNKQFLGLTTLKRYLDRFSRFAWLTNVTNRHTDRPRYSVCSNSPHCMHCTLWFKTDRNNSGQRQEIGAQGIKVSQSPKRVIIKISVWRSKRPKLQPQKLVILQKYKTMNPPPKALDDIENAKVKLKIVLRPFIFNLVIFC